MGYQILNDIDDAIDNAELSVEIAVFESYSKLFSMLSYNDYHEEIIQESALYYMEADDNGEGKKSFVERVKNLIKHIGESMKRVMTKLINMIQKQLNKITRSQYMEMVNWLMILDVLMNTKTNKIVKEGYECIEVEFMGIYQEMNDPNFDDESTFFQEVDARTNPANPEDMPKNVRKQYLKQNKGLIKDIKKEYKEKIRHNLLSKKEIKDIVLKLAGTYSPADMSLITDAVHQYANSSELSAFSREVQANHDIVDILIKEKIEDHKTEITIRNQAEHGIDDTIERFSQWGKFADKLGKKIDAATNTKHFSDKTDTSYAIMSPGIKGKATVFADLAGLIWHTALNTGIAVINARHMNERFTIISEDFQKIGQALIEGTVEARNELDRTTNKTVKSVDFLLTVFEKGRDLIVGFSKNYFDTRNDIRNIRDINVIKSKIKDVMKNGPMSVGKFLFDCLLAGAIVGVPTAITTGDVHAGIVSGTVGALDKARKTITLKGAGEIAKSSGIDAGKGYVASKIVTDPYNIQKSDRQLGIEKLRSRYGDMGEKT